MSNILIQGTLAANGNFAIVDGYVTYEGFATGSFPAASSYAAGTVVRNTTDNTLYITDGATWTAVGSGSGSGTVTSVTATAPLTGGTITTSGSIGIPQASGSQDGYLSQGDWTTFNSKVGGSGTSGQVTFWNGSSSVTGSSSFLYADGTGITDGYDLLFTAGADHSILVQASTITGQVGNKLTIKSADGYSADGTTDYNGGDLVIKSGAGSGSSGNANGGNIYLTGNDGGTGVGETGGPYGGSIFLDGGAGHSGASAGNIYINQNANTRYVYCGSDIRLYSGTGTFSDAIGPRYFGWSGMSADDYQNAPQLQIAGARGGFAQSSPGGNAGAGSDIVILSGPGGLGNNSIVGGPAGPGGALYLTAGDGGTGGNDTALANGGSIHINAGASGQVSSIDGYVYIGDSHMHGLSFWAVTPTTQPNTTGTTTGFTAGSGTAVNDDSTFTGNLGSTAYTIGDIVNALKKLGLMAQ